MASLGGWPSHPFADGNGRTGRALIEYMFLPEGLSPSGALPVSSALMTSRDRYFETLNTAKVLCEPDDPTRRSAFQPWVELMSEATEHACLLSERLTDHISSLSSRWESLARNNRERTSSAAFRLLRVLQQHPVVTADSVMRTLSLNKSAAHWAVTKLAELGILTQRSAGKRNRVFECGDLMDAFTESTRGKPPEALPFLPASDNNASKPRARSMRREDHKRETMRTSQTVQRATMPSRPSPTAIDREAYRIASIASTGRRLHDQLGHVAAMVLPRARCRIPAGSGACAGITPLRPTTRTEVPRPGAKLLRPLR